MDRGSCKALTDVQVFEMIIAQALTLVKGSGASLTNQADLSMYYDNFAIQGISRLLDNGSRM